MSRDHTNRDLVLLFELRLLVLLKVGVVDTEFTLTAHMVEVLQLSVCLLFRIKGLCHLPLSILIMFDGRVLSNLSCIKYFQSLGYLHQVNRIIRNEGVKWIFRMGFW